MLTGDSCRNVAVRSEDSVSLQTNLKMVFKLVHEECHLSLGKIMVNAPTCKYTIWKFLKIIHLKITAKKNI